MAVLLMALLPAGAVLACVRAAPDPGFNPFFEVDPSLSAQDTQAPRPIVDATATVSRRTDTVCSGGECTMHSCGRSASVVVDYARDESNGMAEDLGYRVELLSGRLPESMADWVGPMRPLASIIHFDVAFDDAPDVDATVAIVVVDRAGNESAPSPPLRLVWSGCTLPPVGEHCMGQQDGCRAAGIERTYGLGWVLLALFLMRGRVRR